MRRTAAKPRTRMMTAAAESALRKIISPYLLKEADILENENEKSSVYREAARVSGIIFLFGLIELVIFSIFMSFRRDVLIGVLYGCAFASLNFFYLAFCVKQSVKRTEGAAKAFMGATYTTRIILCGVMIVIAAKVAAINLWAAIIPLFFQRFAVFAVNFFGKRGNNA